MLASRRIGAGSDPPPAQPSPVATRRAALATRRGRPRGRRLNQSVVHADAYLSQFPQHLASIVARFIAFILSALIGTRALMHKHAGARMRARTRTYTRAHTGTLVFMGVLSEKIMSSTLDERNLWW